MNNPSGISATRLNGRVDRVNNFLFSQSVVNEIRTTDLPNHSDGQIAGVPVVQEAPELLINNMPRLSMMLPADEGFAQWVEEKDGRRVAGVTELDISEHAAVIALENLAESIANY